VKIPCFGGCGTLRDGKLEDMGYWCSDCKKRRDEEVRRIRKNWAAFDEPEERR
jgi:hypothetical protein